MPKYYLAAAALRFFSLHPRLQAVYRTLGKRKHNRPVTCRYARWVWEQTVAADVLDFDSRLLELGTGWTHANSLYAALAGQPAIAAFDVVDNRSLASLQYQLPFLLEDMRGNDQLDGAALAEAERKAALVGEAPDFEEAYKILNLHYQVRADGVPRFPPASFDMIYSMDVLEHVQREDFKAAARHWHGLLKPGGTFIAQVGLDDHLAHYDSGKSPKHYLRHSEMFWAMLLENDLQYINRLTASEILQALCAAGFTIEETEIEACDPARLTVHPNYRTQSPEDLSAVRLTLRARASA